MYGWDISDDSALKPYKNRQSELSVLDGCLLRGSRVIVPKAGQGIILNQLHETHPGITKTKALAHCFVWWPGIDADIESQVQNCTICQKNRAAPPKAELHPWEWPQRPWSCLHIDHLRPYLGHTFLLIVDAHSKWIKAQVVSSTLAEITIKKLTDIFSTHGIPNQIVSDNGTGFTSQEFEEFTKANGIRHTFTSPYHPASNGLAERDVQTFKHGIGKLNGPVEKRIARFLFHDRITPQSSTGISPLELLMGRRLRCKLDCLHPDVSKRIEQQQEKMITGAVRRTVRCFIEGDKLYARSFRNSLKWIPVVVERKTGLVSYKVNSLSPIFNCVDFRVAGLAILRCK